MEQVWSKRYCQLCGMPRHRTRGVFKEPIGIGRISTLGKGSEFRILKNQRSVEKFIREIGKRSPYVKAATMSRRDSEGFWWQIYLVGEPAGEDTLSSTERWFFFYR